MKMSVRVGVVIAVLATLMSAGQIRAQNPIQWQGNAQSAIALAKEQMMPLLVWVSESRDVGDDDDLKDAQENSFRDPDVRNVAMKQYVPVRVYRNSRSIQEMERLGLPTNYALYLAVVSPDGKVLDQINPAEVTQAGALAARLAKVVEKYREDVYAQQLRPVIVNPEAKKEDVREALRAAWRLGVAGAAKDVIGLLDRKDLNAGEKRRLYAMLAGLGTPQAVTMLLDRAAAGDKDAATELDRAEAGALETLLKELPSGAEKEMTVRQVEAYKATVMVGRVSNLKTEGWWKEATAEAKQKEIERVRVRAEGVLQFWMEREGRKAG